MIKASSNPLDGNPLPLPPSTVCYWVPPSVESNATSTYPDAAPDTYIAGSTIDITCDLGYELSMNEITRTQSCTQDGWDSSAVTCQKG